MRNILAVTGDPPEEADYPGARGVYEVDAIGLTRAARALNRGEDFRGRTIDAPTSFYFGVAVNPTADDLDVELDRFERKLEAGAQFAMTQILFDLLPRPFLERLGGASPIPLLVGVWPLRACSSRSGSTTRCRGSSCPSRCRSALRDAGADAREVGVRSRASSSPRRTRTRAGHLRRRAVPAAAGRARAPGV